MDKFSGLCLSLDRGLKPKSICHSHRSHSERQFCGRHRETPQPGSSWLLNPDFCLILGPHYRIVI